MPVEPTGPEGLPYKNLRDLLSESATFQAWVGAANATEALARIHYHGFKAPLTKTRPYALVAPATFDSFHWEKTAGGASNHYSVSGRLVMTLAQDVDSEQDVDDQRTTFMNTTGPIIADVSRLSAVDDRLDMFMGDRPETAILTGKNDNQDKPIMVDSVYEIEFRGTVME